MVTVPRGMQVIEVGEGEDTETQRGCDRVRNGGAQRLREGGLQNNRQQRARGGTEAFRRRHVQPKSEVDGK